MSRSNSISVDAMAIGVAAAAIAGAAASYVGLTSLARPANASTQMVMIKQRTDEAEQIRSHLKFPPSYPRGAVCDGGGEAGLSMIRQGISGVAGRNGGLAAEVYGTPGAPDEANGGLQPVNLTIDGNGASAAVISFLQSLSTITPSIFVDKLDLRSADGKVTLKLTGRIFCSPAHL